MTVLVIGGSGSGKSAWAESVIAKSPQKKRVYIATMQAADSESETRVRRHRAQRASLGFETVERARDLGTLRLEAGCAALLEDIPNLLANEMFGGGDWQRIVPDIEKLSRQCDLLIIVTGNVFCDGIRYDKSTQQYLRHLAEINHAIAALADTVTEVVYSIPVALKGALPCS